MTRHPVCLGADGGWQLWLLFCVQLLLPHTLPTPAPVPAHRQDAAAPAASPTPNQPSTQVENYLAGSPLSTRKAARILIVFVLSYVTAYMETLTIAHVSGLLTVHSRVVEAGAQCVRPSQQLGQKRCERRSARNARLQPHVLPPSQPSPLAVPLLHIR